MSIFFFFAKSQHFLAKIIPLLKAIVWEQCWTQSIFGIPFTDGIVNLDWWPAMLGAEGMKIFDFDNPRSLEKALSGTELHQKLLLLTKKYYKY